MTEGNVVAFRPREKKESNYLVDKDVPSNMRSLAEAFNEGSIKGMVVLTFENKGEEKLNEEVRVRVAIDGLSAIQVLALQGALTQVQTYIAESLTGGGG